MKYIVLRRNILAYMDADPAIKTGELQSPPV
ncbi:hypothetical protein ALPO108162_03795 [Alicyclobacillus pomorum]